MRPSFTRRFVIPMTTGIVGGAVTLAAVSAVAFLFWIVWTLVAG